VKPDQVAASIDKLLQKRGSPMAGLGNVFVAAGQKYGVDPRLVASISGIESNFGKATLGAHNAWGWGPGHSFGSWAEGIAAVTQGLKHGYISQGLRTPDQIVRKYSPGSAGNDEGNWAKTVSTFMKELGAPATIAATRSGSPPPTGRTATGAPKLPPTPSFAGIRGAALSNLADIAMRGGRTDPFSALTNILGGVQYDRQADAAALAEYQQAPKGTRGVTIPTAVPNKRGAKTFSTKWLPKPGKLIGSPHSGTHTLGNWQSDNAVDIALPVGTPIYAPVGGKLGNTGLLAGAGPSGGGRFAGQRINLYGAGQGFYFAHLSQLAQGIRQGATVKKGQLLGYTGEANGVAHLHFGVENGSPYTYVQKG